MPNSAEHDAKYRLNRALLDSGLSATSPEWAAVVAFYAAVHLVERLAAAEARGPVHHRTHADRFRYLRAHRQHRSILREYAELQDASEISRYGTINQFRASYPGAAVQDQLIDVHLRAIEEYVAAYFAPPPSPPPGPSVPPAPPPTGGLTAT
jgi:hypothetical protein